MSSPAGPVPAWFLPWGAFLFLIPFAGGIIEGVGLSLPYNLMGLAAAMLLFVGARRHVPVNGRMLAVTGLMAILCLSFFSSLDPASTRQALVSIGITWAIYLLATSVALPHALVEVGMRSWLWGGVAAALIAIAGFVTGSRGVDGRATLILLGAEMDPNFFVAGLHIPFALCVHFLRRPERRWEGMGCGLVLLIACLLSQSRGGLMGLCLATVMVLLWERRWRLLLATGALAVTAVVALSSHLERFDLSQDPTGAGRTETWQVAIAEGIERWPTGVGFAALPVVTAPAPGLYWSRDAHNTYVQAFAEAGLPGLLALAAVFATHLAARPRKGLLVPAQATLVGLLLVSVFLHLLTYKLLWVAWIVAAQAATATDPEPSIAAHLQPRRITP